MSTGICSKCLILLSNCNQSGIWQQTLTKTPDVEISQKSVRKNQAVICRQMNGRKDWEQTRQG